MLASALLDKLLCPPDPRCPTAAYFTILFHVLVNQSDSHYRTYSQCLHLYQCLNIITITCIIIITNILLSTVHSVRLYRSGGGGVVLVTNLGLRVFLNNNYASGKRQMTGLESPRLCMT